ncbi:MAG TPA: PLP-dependent aminotransferase family protein [Candidatus Gemmiger faecigallinarum]|nr:PLP-dependent aminotransferase family protein [Candidatus Gemmiger faecigallinarum]
MITLHPESATPLYEQLYRALAADIQNGALPPGKPLPGRRSMAARLGVSVSTVDTAYQMLAAEGLAESRPRRGFFVQETGGMLQSGAPRAAAAAPAPPQPAPAYRYDLSTTGIDTALFPARSWGRIQRDLLYNSPQLLQRGEAQGDAELRAAIADYLGAYRGVRCTPEQVVVGAGIEYLLGCLAHLFAGGAAAVENPGYSRARAVLQNSGIPCRPAHIDKSGLSVQSLAGTGANLCYITPSHHFPTGVTMPAPRRAQLLAWAREAPGRYILEDDYDSEFRFDIRPLPSLQGIAGPDGPVVYLTTFSKSLAPGIRIACMVLPGPLLQRYRQDFALYSNTVSRFEQQTLSRFMTGGYFTRHLARMRLAYKKRMERLTAALTAALGPGLAIRGRHSGLHLLLTLPGAGGEARMVAAAAQAGVRLHGLSEYYWARPELCPADTVVAGYAALPDDQIDGAAAALAAAWLPGAQSSSSRACSTPPPSRR